MVSMYPEKRTTRAGAQRIQPEAMSFLLVHFCPMPYAFCLITRGDQFATRIGMIT